MSDAPEGVEPSYEAYALTAQSAPAPYERGHEGRLKRYQDFRAVFGTEQGLRVFHEILRMAGINTTPVREAAKAVDTDWLTFATGRRALGLAVIGVMYDEPKRPQDGAQKRKDSDET